MPSEKSGPDDQGGGGRSGGMPSWLVPVLLAVVALVMISALYSQDRSASEQSYSDFVAQVDDGDVEKVTWNTADGTITGELADGQEFTTTGPLEAPPELDTTMRDKGVEVNYDYPTPNFFATMIPLLLPFLLIIGFFVWMNRRAQGQMGGIMSIGRSKAKTYTTERPATVFGDVAGYEGVKREIAEVVDFLKEPERFLEIGAKIPKGVLLVGPPGTGKTLIARAVAGEAGVPFLSVSGSDFMEMFVGVGASRVRDLFESARKHGRAIIFIDEIDSVGRKRGAGLGGGHDEREQTLNQMLSEMDGFEGHEGIVMMAATNRPDILDPALLRPGRFDRQVVVPLPELEDRRAILAVHVRHKKLSPAVDLDVVARGTPGMSGADLANLVNESALTAVRRGSKVIEPHDFEEARDRVMMGQQRESMVLTGHEKEMTAFHEAGHALCAALLPTADPVHKVTILPRGMALGVTQQLPEEEKHSYSQEYLEESIIVAMGGRVAEDLVFGQRSTGAANDLQVSTERARKMVTEFGMSERIGPRAYGNSAPVFLGDDIGHAREYSEETSKIIDDEVDRIVRDAEDGCSQLLVANRRALDLIARALLEEETVSGAEVSRLIRVANGTEPDVGRPAPPTTHGSPTPVHGHVPGSQNPGAMTAPPPLPPHLNPGGVARGTSDAP
jgi:cell division protease FtsH